MDFSESVKQFSKQVATRKETARTEEATKMSLIVPLFQLLGYDVFNPAEFCPEYTADVGIKKGEKVDYAILEDGKPAILIECKSCTEPLTKHASQLFRYFGTTAAKFGILTNGIHYKFYTDLEESNKMDLSPFLEIDMTNPKDTAIAELKKFRKEIFDREKIFSTAEELKYSSSIKEYLAGELENPSDGFVKHILYHVYDGQRTQKVIDKYQPLIKRAFTAFINEIVNQKISSALTPDEERADVPEEPQEERSKIVTTEEELEAFYAVRGMLAEVVPAEDIAHRDTESYFGILYKDNNRKPICRLNLDRKNKQLFLPDGNKNFEKIIIESVTDLYKYKARLIEAVKLYL